MTVEPWEVEDRVQLGIKVLDQHFGSQEWVNMIDLERLRLESSCACVLGQTFGRYYRGLDALASGVDWVADWSADHGFVVKKSYDEYSALTIAWRQAIENLRKQL